MTGHQFPRQYAGRTLYVFTARVLGRVGHYGLPHTRRTARWWTPLPQAAIYPKDRR